MNFKIKNRSNLNLSEMKPFLESFLPFAQRKMGFDQPVDISFVSDPKNSQEMLGKTAFYDPNTFSVSVYTDQRHPKDILRSLSHELVHHAQNCRGAFDKKPEMGEGYFQNDGYMREMEREAYEKGNMYFREWEETYKKQLQESIYYSTGDTTMNHKDWKNEALFGRLMESFGYKTPETNEISHLCAMLVTETSTGKTGHPINHTLLENGDVTHYDVEFDDVIVEGMPVEALTVEVQKEHMHSGRREDKPHDEGKPRKKYMEEEEELDEAHCGRREDEELDEAHCGRREDEELEEAKGEKGKYDGPDSKHAAGIDKDADGVPDGGDADEDDPDVQQEANEGEKALNEEAADCYKDYEAGGLSKKELEDCLDRFDGGRRRRRSRGDAGRRTRDYDIDYGGNFEYTYGENKIREAIRKAIKKTLK